MDLARARLTEERKLLATGRPIGTWGKPCKAADGSVDLFRWYFGVRPAPSSRYALPEGETYRVEVHFKPTYPASPPAVKFDPPIYHTNVWPDGRVCLSLLLEEGHHGGAHQGFWQASRTFSEILRSLSIFLDEPNPDSVANADACRDLKASSVLYWKKVDECVRDYPVRLARRLEAEKK